MKAILFQHGGWSNINASLWEAFENEWPDLETETIDYAQLSSSGHLFRFLLYAQGLIEYRKRIVTHLPNGLGSAYYEALDCVHLTSSAFQRSNRRVRKAIVDADQLSFVLQTGTRYDAMIKGVPHFIYTDHTHLTNLQYPSFDKKNLNVPKWIAAERNLYQNCTGIFTMSENVRRSLIEDYQVSPDKCVTVGAGSNVARGSSQTLKRKKNGKKILFVGKDWERKGGEVLASAFKRVRQQHPDATLTIVGCDPGIREDGIVATGYLSLSEVREHFLSADVFCMPSRREPFGIVYLEAMALGLPVVAAEIGALPEIVDDGVSGRLVPPDNPILLAEALSELLSSPETLSRYAVRGFSKIDEFYNWQAVAARLKCEIEARL